MDRVDMIRNAMQENGVKFAECSEEMLELIQEKYDILFPQILKDFYLGGIPVGSRYPKWLSETMEAEKETRRMLHFPVHSVIAAVENNDFWLEDWGDKTDSDSETISGIREWMGKACDDNPLIPLVGHCYLICNDTEEAGPVISIYGEDVVIMGENLYDFLEKRYKLKERTPVTKEMVAACGAWASLVG